jgi:hypothetical protein
MMSGSLLSFEEMKIALFAQAARLNPDQRYGLWWLLLLEAQPVRHSHGQRQVDDASLDDRHGQSRYRQA